MKAEKFFENEEIESKFEKIPEGDSYIQKDTLEITKELKVIAGNEKERYNLKFKDRKGEDREYEVGISIVRGIKKCWSDEEPFIRITRQGLTKEDTKYTVTSVE